MNDLKLREPLIFELSQPGRRAMSQFPPVPADAGGATDPAASAVRGARIPRHLRRLNRPQLPEVSELQVVRHFTRLSQLNFSIDSHFYPLGSCTMKYNPKLCDTVAGLPGLASVHPGAPA